MRVPRLFPSTSLPVPADTASNWDVITLRPWLCIAHRTIGPCLAAPLEMIRPPGVDFAYVYPFPTCARFARVDLPVIVIVKSSVSRDDLWLVGQHQALLETRVCCPGCAPLLPLAMEYLTVTARVFFVLSRPSQFNVPFKGASPLGLLITL